MKNITLLIVFFTMAISAQNNDLQPLVNVTGEGKVNVSPDGADIRVRVETQGKDANSVKTENDQSIDKVIKFLRGEGIENKHVKTEYINLSKNYDYNTKTYNYNANQTLTIQLKDLTVYERMMTGLLNSGINRIDGVTFTSSKMDALQAEARVKAIKNAKNKALAYAGALNQTIGKAVQISEQGSATPPQPIYKMRMSAMEADSSGGETIAPGEIEIIVRISVSFILD